ncbi:hypothetical protein TV39_16160 [Arthrobacter sp. SPG23]|nr:hypothetical protein TV39_16160 [Arthrobacter sp. SPG23]
MIGPGDLAGAGTDKDVPDPLEAPFLPPRRDATAEGTFRWLVCFDYDLPRPSASTVAEMTR